MSFTVTRIEVRDFRNYERIILEPDETLTVIAGPNGVGKTNLLEAVQLLTEGESFKKPSWADVIRWGAREASLFLVGEDGNRRRDVALTVSESGRRKYAVNGKQRRALTDVAGEIPCVIFTPDDLRIVKGTSERRRAAVDSMGTQLSSTYARLKTEYERVVRQRNRLLREEDGDEDTLSVWDERLVSLGSRLTAHRAGLFKRIAVKTTAAYLDIATDGEVVARYIPSWERDGIEGSIEDGTTSMESHLQTKQTEEKARKTTLVGPHRDEIVFELNGKDSRTFASQGQQRSIALAFKLAEVSVVAEVSGKRPILLLDDVMSELDERRRHSLAGMVGEATQTIMTTTNLGYFDGALLERAKVVTL